MLLTLGGCLNTRVSTLRAFQHRGFATQGFDRRSQHWGEGIQPEISTWSFNMEFRHGRGSGARVTI